MRITTVPGWNPGRDVEIRITPLHDGVTSTNRNTRYGVAENYFTSHAQLTQYRTVYMAFHADAGAWIAYPDRNDYYTFEFDKSGVSSRGITLAGPSTVEEWLALHPEWATP